MYKAVKPRSSGGWYNVMDGKTEICTCYDSDVAKYYAKKIAKALNEAEERTKNNKAEDTAEFKDD